MVRPSSRLDLAIVPVDPEASPARALVDDLGVARGWWTRDGDRGPEGAALGVGTFRRAWTEAFERPRLLANQQGGFRVTCPGCGASVVADFQRALRAWREGTGPRRLACPACGQPWALEHLVFQPDAAFASVALHLDHVGHAFPDPAALAAVAGVWGPVRVVGRRTW